MKHLSERAAWLYLAKCCRKPVVWCDIYGIQVSGYDCRGLCRAIGSLFVGNEISLSTWESMRNKVKHVAVNETYRPYKWSNSPAGWRARTRFCERQAELCKRQPKRKRVTA